MPTEKPSAEKLRLARVQGKRMADAIDAGRTSPGFRYIESDTIRTLLAATEPEDPIADPRPSDMAELARLVAKELRGRGIWASHTTSEPPLCAVAVPAMYQGKAGFMRFHSLLFGQFDNLGPKACADVIQQEERRRAREWAGDE